MAFLCADFCASQTISNAAAMRTDGIGACVASNASIAANTSRTAVLAISFECLTISRQALYTEFAMLKIFALLLISLTALSAQNFDIASVKRSAPGTASDAIPAQSDPMRLNYSGVTLKAVLAQAYGVTPDQIVGPKWLGDERFDIVATLPAGAKPQQVPVMLQHLLADRFGVAVHEENKTAAFSALVPAKGGAKMKNVEKPEIGATVDLTSDNIQLKGYTMPAFARFLSTAMGHPVVDETALSGSFDITLYLSMADIKTGKIRIAIQQLGLAFENRTGPVKSLVVDKANKVPTDN